MSNPSLNFMPSQILAYDFIEYYVSSAKLYAFWHVEMFGFELKAHYIGKDSTAYWLQREDICLVFRSNIQPQSGEFSQYVQHHGSGIRSIAVRVAAIEAVYSDLQQKGLTSTQVPQKQTDAQGTIQTAILELLGNLQLILIDRTTYHGDFLPEFTPVESLSKPRESHITALDHIAFAVEAGSSEQCQAQLSAVFGVTEQQTFRADSEVIAGAGMQLKILQDAESHFTFVLAEPEHAQGNSQINEYLHYHQGNGVQHLAFATGDIFRTIDALRAKGQQFMPSPASYYAMIAPYINPEVVDSERLQRYGVLCDREEDTYLLQIFTQFIDDRPTLFYEIVQRIADYAGFGVGNVNALMKAYDLERTIRNT